MKYTVARNGSSCIRTTSHSESIKAFKRIKEEIGKNIYLVLTSFDIPQNLYSNIHVVDLRCVKKLTQMVN